MSYIPLIWREAYGFITGLGLLGTEAYTGGLQEMEKHHLRDKLAAEAMVLRALTIHDVGVGLWKEEEREMKDVTLSFHVQILLVSGFDKRLKEIEETRENLNEQMKERRAE